MYNLKGFMVIHPLIDNDVNVVSKLGELSTYSRTFSKDTQTHTSTETPDVSFVSFYSQKDDQGQSKATIEYILPILRLAQWMYNEAGSGGFGDNETTFVNTILQEKSDIVSEIVIGEMITSSDDSAQVKTYLPSYITIKLQGISEDHSVRIWFSDGHFRTQYDETETVIVPPFDDIDDLMLIQTEVKARLDSQDSSVNMKRLQDAQGDKPATHVKIELYDWANPLQPENKLSIPFGVIIYGPSGNNLDNIKESIVNYILAHSTNKRDTWEEYIPDLFKATEFIITPLWTNYSIPNETLVKGLYSPIIAYNKILAIALATANRYTEEHTRSVVETCVSNYRSISFTSVGGPDNKDGINKLSLKYPDYVVLPTTSTEFGRMSLDTQNFVMMLTEMLSIAEEMTENSDINSSRYVRINRNGIMYLAGSLGKFQILVVPRYSYIELFGDDQDTIEVVDDEETTDPLDNFDPNDYDKMIDEETLEIYFYNGDNGDYVHNGDVEYDILVDFYASLEVDYTKYVRVMDEVNNVVYFYNLENGDSIVEAEEAFASLEYVYTGSDNETVSETNYIRAADIRGMLANYTYNDTTNPVMYQNFNVTPASLIYPGTVEFEVLEAYRANNP